LLHGLIERYPKYKKAGLEIIVFIQSSREDIEEYPMKRQKPKPEFPIIADPERTIYDKYGVELSVTKAVRGLVKAPLSFSKLAKLHFPQGKIDGKLLLMPAFFLIQRDLSVYKPYYTVDFSTGVPDIDILDFLLYE
jgi:peroxiredoxin Q/BCP